MRCIPAVLLLASAIFVPTAPPVRAQSAAEPLPPSERSRRLPEPSTRPSSAPEPVALPVRPPTLVHLVLPERPAEAPDTVTVRLRVRIDEAGKVENVRPADPRLAALPSALADTLVARAADAVRHALFAPGWGPEGLVASVRFLVVPFAGERLSREQVTPRERRPGTYLSDCAVFTQPEKLFGIDPEYPDDLRRQGIDGRVVIGLVVGVDGRTSQHEMKRTDHHGLVQPTISALRTWHYTPATCNGMPFPVALTVPIHFRTGSATERPRPFPGAQRAFPSDPRMRRGGN